MRHFATPPAGLLPLADGLESHRCTHVAMEATDVYRTPVWPVLKAKPVRNVPGPEADVTVAMWLV